MSEVSESWLGLRPVRSGESGWQVCVSLCRSSSGICFPAIGRINGEQLFLIFSKWEMILESTRCLKLPM